MSNGRSRPGSIFGALLLIAVGGLFLYANFNPAFRPWPLLARWWPLLIVLWGLAKLVNYLALRGSPEAAAAARVSAGDIFGLVLLILFGSFFSHMATAGWWNMPGLVIGGEEIGCLVGREYDFTQEVSETVEGPTSFHLDNARGSVKVSAGSADRLRVVARKKVCAPTEEEARQLAAHFDPVLEPSGAGYAFLWKAEGARRRSLRSDLEVQVPPGTALRLANRRGDVEIENLAADVRLDLHDGDARLENIAGGVTVELDDGSARLANISGDARVTGDGGEIVFTDIAGAATLEGGFYGPLRFTRISGPVRFDSRRTELRVPRVDGEVSFVSGNLVLRGIPGDVNIDTRDKEIEIENVTGGVLVENKNGPVLLRYRTQPTRDIRVETRRGDIELYLPADSGFEVSARARDGEIESDFTAPTLSVRRARDQETLSGTYGTRRATLRLSTTYGTIYLRHALAAGSSD